MKPVWCWCWCLFDVCCFVLGLGGWCGPSAACSLSVARLAAVTNYQSSVRCVVKQSSISLAGWWQAQSTMCGSPPISSLSAEAAAVALPTGGVVRKIPSAHAIVCRVSI